MSLVSELTHRRARCVTARPVVRRSAPWPSIAWRVMPPRPREVRCAARLRFAASILAATRIAQSRAMIDVVPSGNRSAESAEAVRAAARLGAVGSTQRAGRWQAGSASLDGAPQCKAAR